MSSHLVKKMWSHTAKFWQKIEPPHKPSPSEIALFYEIKLKQVLKRLPQARVLVLGATPELRDLLARYHCDVTLLDINPVMCAAMSHLTKRLNPREKIVFGSWLKMPFADGTFDLIMSDHPTSSLYHRDFNNFFQEIRRVLAPVGRVIIDIHVNARLKKLTLDDGINFYRQNKKWWRSSNHNRVLIQHQVVMGYPDFYNSGTYRSRWGKFDLLLRKKMERGQISKTEYHDLILGLGEMNVYTFPPKEFCDRVVKRWFHIISNNQLKLHPVYQYYVPYFLKIKF